MSNNSNGYITAEELSIQNHLCMLPCGDASDEYSSDWTKEELKYYQHYIVEGNPVDTMFKAFIFNPIRVREDYFIHSMHTGLGKFARNNDWLQIIERLFMDDVNLDALYQNTKYGERTDVWVTIPYPNPLQERFGHVFGNNLNFVNDSDRIKAVQWWIDCFMMRWEEKTNLHDKLVLRGFAWQRESINSGDEALVKASNEYIHKHQLLSIWPFNYGSTGCLNWKEYGFDAAVANPNYYGNTEVDTNWITNTSVFAKHYHTGIQINYGKGSTYNSTHIYDYLNLGLTNEFIQNCLLLYQFQDQTMKQIYEEDITAYIQIYSFIKNIYQQFRYPGILY